MGGQSVIPRLPHAMVWHGITRRGSGVKMPSVWIGVRCRHSEFRSSQPLPSICRFSKQFHRYGVSCARYRTLG